MGYGGYEETTPSTPASNKYHLYYDSTDNRIKIVTETGMIQVLTPHGFQEYYLINGGFDINQRLASALTNIPSPSTTGRVYTADRWGFTVGNATTPQYQQVDTVTAPESNLASRYYSRYKQLTNAAKMCVSQVIVGTETVRLRGRTVRLQVKLRNSVGSNKNIKIGILQLTNAGTVDTIPATFISAFNGDTVEPTFGTNLSPIAPSSSGLDNTTVVGNFLNCAITSSWQRFSGLFTIPSNCLNIIVVIFNDTVGAANDDLLIAEANLHDGQEIWDWNPLPFETELLRCQRFYCNTFPASVTPAQNAGLAGSVRGPVVIAGAVATSWNGKEFRFPVTMFKTPTLTFYNPSAANAFVRNITLSTDATATASANVGDRGAHINCTGLAAWAVGNDSAVHIAADAEL